MAFLGFFLLSYRLFKILKSKAPAIQPGSDAREIAFCPSEGSHVRRRLTTRVWSTILRALGLFPNNMVECRRVSLMLHVGLMPYPSPEGKEAVDMEGRMPQSKYVPHCSYFARYYHGIKGKRMPRLKCISRTLTAMLRIFAAFPYIFQRSPTLWELKYWLKERRFWHQWNCPLEFVRWLLINVSFRIIRVNLELHVCVHSSYSNQLHY